MVSISIYAESIAILRASKREIGIMLLLLLFLPSADKRLISASPVFGLSSLP